MASNLVLLTLTLTPNHLSTVRKEKFYPGAFLQTILLCNRTFGLGAGVYLCNCLLTFVMLLLYLCKNICLFVCWCLFCASLVARLVQEGTFVASECLRKPARGLTAGEDTSAASQLASSLLLSVGQSKSPQSHVKLEIQKFTKPKEFRYPDN